MLKKIMNMDKVLGIAVVLALVSACIVTPDSGYPGYMDFRTMAMLFSLMLVMEGIKQTGFFDNAAMCILSRARNIRQLVILLISLCFFSSMVITNDVALITFVPFTIAVLNMLGKEIKSKWMIPVIVMQTIAANLGSMLTPIGNPQNLYLSSRAGDDFAEFIMMMMPLTVVSFAMIALWSMIECRNAIDTINVSFDSRKLAKEVCKPDRVLFPIKLFNENRLYIYIALFLICILAVAGTIDYRIASGIVLIVTAVTDIKMFRRVDYSLIMTFAALFIFIGNLGRMEIFGTFLGNIVASNEFIAAIAASQIISNVPAALLLSGFTHNYTALIVGTNIGGLGTMIASMASLISYKEHMKLYNIYFSPTGGTYRVASVISGDLSERLAAETEEIDLTDSDTDSASVRICDGDIALISVPSFGGRVPNTAAERISAVDGNGAKAVLICVYGGRAYEDTIIELRDLAVGAGFKVIAAAGAVAEHSIARGFAKGRPDAQDVSSLREYSAAIADKISKGDDSEPHVPGNAPYKKYGVLKMVPYPDEKCVHCMFCIDKCPVHAINNTDPASVDEDVCISCMRCAAVCPHSARKVKKAALEKLEKMLMKACKERKGYELFI